MIGIKIGGSLLEQAGEILEILKDKDVVIIPGGGIFADFIREKQKELDFSDSAAHNMAILSMEQYGYFLGDLSGIPTETEILSRSGPYIFLPSHFLSVKDPFPQDWKVTSDTIGLYICSRMDVEKYIILTDVEGIIENGETLKEVDSRSLAKMGETSVDVAFADYYEEFFVDTWVVNGKDPDKIKKIFQGTYSGTRITP